MMNSLISTTNAAASFELVRNPKVKPGMVEQLPIKPPEMHTRQTAPTEQVTLSDRAQNINMSIDMNIDKKVAEQPLTYGHLRSGLS